MNIQPKPYLDRLKGRKKSYGFERRLNMDKLILKKGTPLPKTVELEDIDVAFNKWVESLSVSFEGKRLPTFKLFSNQRISEYSQTWEHVDELGNLLLNFFTVTRDNNPKQGQGQGGYFNIPGNRSYPMFIVPTLQENGEEYYDMYSVKQPFCVDMQYSLTLITNKYELINKVNELVLNEFKSLQCYISPNDHPMPMKLDDVTDESEYSIDDRKYYSQTYKITIKSYIIRKEDYVVTKLPSRVVRGYFNEGKGYKRNPKPEVKIEECECGCNIKDFIEYDPYAKKEIVLTVEFDTCSYRVNFDCDEKFNVYDINTFNVFDFTLKINGEIVNFENDLTIYNGDNIEIEISRDNIMKSSSVTLIGLSDEVVNTEEKELYIDDDVIREEIVVK